MTNEQIITATGVQPVECNCKDCQSMCLNAPCIGTPDDIITLMNNGYIEYLAFVGWCVGIEHGVPEISMVQIDHHLTKDGSCPLFKNGLCSIHHIKPLDGKLASCKHKSYEDFKQGIPPAYYVASTWLEIENIPKVAFIMKAVALYKSHTN